MSSADSSSDEEQLGDGIGIGQSLRRTDSLARTNAADQLVQRTLATYRYENAMVKTELLSCMERHKREIQELELKYKNKVLELEQHGQDASKRINELQDKSTTDLKNLQQTNIMLQQKMNALGEELEQADNAKKLLQEEKKHLQSEMHRAELSRKQEAVAWEGEKSRLNENLKKLKLEYDEECSNVHSLTLQLEQEKHKHTLMKGRLDEVEQQLQVQLLTAKGDAEKAVKELEEQSQISKKTIEDLTRTVEEGRSALVRQKERSLEKEHSLEKKLAEQRQIHLTSNHQVNQQNLQLQKELKIYEEKALSESLKHKQQVVELEHNIQEIRLKMYESEKAKAVLEAKVNEYEALEDTIQKEREEASELRQKLHLERVEKEEVLQKNNELQESIRSCDKIIENVRAELDESKKAKTQYEMTQNQVLTDVQIGHKEEIEQLQGRISSLQEQLNHKNRKYLEECNQLKQKVSTYGKLIKKLRHKLELGTLQVEELEAQRSALQENVPPHVYRQLQQQLEAMTRKHNEFSAFIRGMNEFNSCLPEMSGLTAKMNLVGQRLAQLEESQAQCFSELESV